MSIVPKRRRLWDNGYPTSDGKPMAETDDHRELMFDLIKMLQAFFAAVRQVYVSGNLLVFYERGNRRKHVSPDVFVVKGVEKRERINYLVWEEGRGPQVVIELTSSSTRKEDTDKKFALYRDVLKVREYFLFDPFGDYLDPRLQGYRLRQGEYRPIRPVNGRLPSQVLGLHLEQEGNTLRLWDPATGKWLPTPDERSGMAEHRAEEAEQRAGEEAQARQQAEQRAEEEAQARRQAEEELDRLRREVEDLRRGRAR
jgi:Uma2 family endonuclease